MDAHSESLLALVHPVLAERVRAVVASLAPNDVRVISGLRTYAEQNVLYLKRPKVTNAKGGQSNHNFGLACDIGIFDANGKYLQESPLYNLIPGAAHAQGLESGADWKHINDRPHVQLHTDLIVNGSPTNACRALFAKGGLQAVFQHVSVAPTPIPVPPVSPQPTPAGTQPPILRRGSKGPDVTTLQQKLRALGYTLPIDGDFGDRTEMIVKKFQASNHIEVDGVCGSGTWRALK